jgi:hypothetical protein
MTAAQNNFCDTSHFPYYPTTTTTTITTACLLTLHNPMSPSYSQLRIRFVKQLSSSVKVQYFAHCNLQIVTDHHLLVPNCTRPFTYRYPIMEIRQIYLAILINIHWRLDLHISRRFHVTHWGIIRMCIHQPDTYWNIVCTTCTKQQFN